VDTEATYSAFVGNRLVMRGSLAEVVDGAKEWFDANVTDRIAIFDDATGHSLEIDFRGTHEEVLARLANHPQMTTSGSVPAPKRRPGRPKLGVVSREVSLLPRHWEWLGEQRGGASAALRRLVDNARKTGRGAERARKAKEAVHRFMWDLAGDFPCFEDVCRALFASDYGTLYRLIAEWPADVREHVERLVANASALEQSASSAVETAGPKPK
jgi:hypothetical protein